MNMKRMSKWVVAVAAALAATVGHAGDSAPFALDTRTGTRIARDTEPIVYSTEWNHGSDVKVFVDDELLKAATAPATGGVVWNAAEADIGNHTLTCESGGVILTAEFFVQGVQVKEADPMKGSITLAWTDAGAGSGVTYSIYRGAGENRAEAELVAPSVTETTWTDENYWMAEPALKPLNYWVVANVPGEGEREYKPVQTRRRFGVFVGLSEFDRTKINASKLPGASKEAEDLCKLFVDHGKMDPANALSMTNSKAKWEKVKGELETKATETQPGDLFVFYLNTHGGYGEGTAGVLFYDYYAKMNEVFTELDCFNPGVVVIPIFSICHSGAFVDYASGNAVIDETSQGFQKFVEAGLAMCRANMPMLAACGNEENSRLHDFENAFIYDGWQNGYADGELQGVGYSGGNGDGYVSFLELIRYAKAFARGSSDAYRSHVQWSAEPLEYEWLLRDSLVGEVPTGGNHPGVPGKPTGVYADQDEAVFRTFVGGNAVANATRYWCYVLKEGRSGNSEDDWECMTYWGERETPFNMVLLGGIDRYRIRAVNGAGASDFSAVAELNAGTAVDSVQTTAKGPGILRFRWKASGEGSGDSEAGFLVDDARQAELDSAGTWKTEGPFRVWGNRDYRLQWVRTGARPVRVELLEWTPTKSAAMGGAEWQYTDDGGEATVMGGEVEGNATIPSVLDGVTVTAVGSWSFAEQVSLFALTVPDSVESIGDGAFSGCSGLGSVDLGNGVTSIGDGAFAGCASLTSMTLPASVDIMGSQVFEGCSSLTTLHVPASWEGTDMLAGAGVPSGCTISYYGETVSMQTVTFNPNGGNCSVTKKKYGQSGTYGTLPTATWSGHAFLGWFTKASGGTKVTAASAVTAASNRTLYAHWTDKQVTTFKGNGGSPGTQKTTNTIGTVFGTLPEVSWANHVFLGWYTEAEGGSRITTNSTVKTMASRTFYAHWTDKQVVTFNGNGGSPETKQMTSRMGVAYGALPTPKWDGYAFLGWFTAANGGVEVKGTDKATAATSRTLWAHWTDKQVTTFSGNGGSPKSQKTTNTIAAAYGALPTAQRVGHAFLGWYTAAEGGTRISANTPVKAVATRTFYAHWTDQAVTTFKGNDGKPVTQKTTNTIGTVFGTLPEVAWANHVFLGWYTEAEGGARITTNSTVKTMASRTFWAHWTDKQVVTFNGNGGTPETKQTTSRMGVAYGTLPTPSRDGHAFLGWFTAANGGVEVKGMDKATAATSRTLWAHWTDKQVTTFSGNGGSPKSQKTTNTIAAAYGTLPTAQRVGHAFLGWYTEAEGGTRISANTPVKAVATRTFYAHWTTNQVATFKGNGGKPVTQKTTNTIGTVFGTLPEVSWTNHVFLGWYTDAEGGARITTNSTVKTMATRTFYAHWTDKQVVTFNGNGGSPETKQMTSRMGVAYGALPTPKWDGYAFLGWFTAANGGVEVKGTDKATAATSRTLWAHWTDKQVTTFSGNGGSPKSQKTTNTIAAAYGTLPTAQRVGHAFLGWYTAAEGGTRISTNTVVKAVAARTFYAHWTTNQVTTFKGNGGSPGTQKTTNTIGAVFGTLPEVAWANHVFLGWYTEAEGGSRITTNSTVKTMAARTFWAHWTDKQVVTFNGNGGTPETKQTTSRMGVAYGTLPTPSRDGHAFLGWFTAANGGVEVKGTDKATAATSRTLWAHWTDKQVATFSGNGGSPKSQKTTNAIAAAYRTLPTAKRVGHAFLGWYTDAEGGTRISTNTPVKAVATRIFYAHWTDQAVTTFKGNGGKPATQKTMNTIGTVFGTLPEVAWTNHVFLGWYTEAEGGSRITTNSTVKTMATRTFWAHWTDKQVVAFNGNGGTPATPKTTNTMGVAYGTLPTAQRAGHAFLGWFTEANGGVEVKGTDKATAETSRTLWAHWTDKQVATFVGNGGSPKSQKTTNTFAAAYGTLPTAQRVGHAFLGWYTAAEGGTRISTNTVVKAVAARTFYAHWTDQAVTTFKGNGGKPGAQKTTNTIGTVFGTLPEVSWTNHVFLGWYTEAEGGSRITTNSTVKTMATRTFWAHWTDKQVVAFNGNGGTPATQQTTNTMGVAYGKLPTVQRDGRAFLGWFTEAEGGTEVTGSDKVPAEASRILWARWKGLPQTVHFDANGGMCSAATATYIVGETYTGFKIPTRDGFTFKGWYTAIDGGTRVKNGMTVTDDAERTLYAHWEATAGTLSITGFSRSLQSAMAARDARAAADEYTLRFVAVAGAVYEILWTPSLDVEWTVLKTWTADADGEAVVPIAVPADSPTGFFRMLGLDGE